MLKFIIGWVLPLFGFKIHSWRPIETDRAVGCLILQQNGGFEVGGSSIYSASNGWEAYSAKYGTRRFEDLIAAKLFCGGLL